MLKIIITTAALITQIISATCTTTTTPQDYCDVYLVRHGETNWNAEGKVQGHTDTPLNKIGEEQALELKEKLKNISFAAIFSSDLMRARQTAEIVRSSDTITIVTSPALRERNMGALEGKSTKDVRQKYYNDGLLHKPHHEMLAYTFDGIEPYAKVYARVKDFIVSRASKHIGSSILVASHGGVMRSVLYTLAFNHGHSWDVSNCAIVRLRVHRNGAISLDEHEGVKLIKNAFS